MNEINDAGAAVTSLFGTIYQAPSWYNKNDGDITSEEKAQFYIAFKKLYDLGNDIHCALKDLQDIYVNVLDTFFNVLAKCSGTHEGWWIVITPTEILTTDYFTRVGIAENWKTKALEVAVRMQKLKACFIHINKKLLM